MKRLPRACRHMARVRGDGRISDRKIWRPKQNMAPCTKTVH
jgi:hypothetical protein